MSWCCPVCGGGRAMPRWPVRSTATENGVDPRLVQPDRFRPSTDRYGETVGVVVRCLDCGHGSLRDAPTAPQLAAAYADAADPTSLDEEPGQVETARRSLQVVERNVAPGALMDIGCWTGSLLVAAGERGWDPRGIEPSAWAVERAAARGLDVRRAELSDAGVAPASQRCVVMCDVIEHLLDPSAGVADAAALLEPGGALYLTTPDAGSAVARLMGSRWWSILPMHVQYFTRHSMRLLLERHGLRVVTVDTHPKVFTAGYYAGRLAGYSPRLARLAGSTTARLGLEARPVAPNFRDRMQVVAVKP